MSELIVLLTDFGLKDGYVGVMKGVMKTIAPTAEFIDLSHEVARQSIQNGALMLYNNYSYFPKGTTFLVLLCIVVNRWSFIKLVNNSFGFAIK